MEVYMTLLLAIFEPAYLGGSPIAEAPDIIELVGRCRPILNIRTQMMHQLALIRCCFISYLQAAHAQADATELVAVLTLMSDCVRQFVDEYAPENHTGESAKFEAAVLPDIVRELEDQLSDYHLCFSDVQTESIGQVFAIFANLKFAHLVGQEAKKAQKDSCIRFIKNSVRRFYRRLTDALQEVMEAGDEDLGMVTDSIKDLAEFLAEDVLVTVVDMANQFVSVLPDAAEAALKELVKCFGNDMQQLFEDNQSLFSSVVEEVYELLYAVRVLVDASSELLDGSALDKLHRGLAQTFVPLIQNELREQRKRFDDMVNRCMENEKWAPLNLDQCVSGSTVDLFRMVGQTLPLMLDSGLLIDTDIANQYIRACILVILGNRSFGAEFLCAVILLVGGDRECR
jgi:NTP pyrophosphatase (non-canonical NTP hydrolase)